MLSEKPSKFAQKRRSDFFQMSHNLIPETTCPLDKRSRILSTNAVMDNPVARPEHFPDGHPDPAGKDADMRNVKHPIKKTNRVAGLSDRLSIVGSR